MEDNEHKLKLEVEHSDHLGQLQTDQVNEFVQEAVLKKEQIDLKAKEKQTQVIEFDAKLKDCEIELQVLEQ